MEGAWYIDPVGRFDGRYFDGEVWTDQVSDAGKLRTDPDGPPPTTPQVADNSADDAIDVKVVPKGAVGTRRFVGEDRRDVGERRNEDIPVAYDKRSGERRQIDAIIVPE